MGFENKESGRTKVAAFVVAICFCLVLSGLIFFGGLVGSNDEQIIKITSRINPNTAPIESLMRLDGIGAVRAYDIVEYRRNCQRNKAFEMADDLQAIRGIGPKTVEKIEHSLRFD